MEIELDPDKQLGADYLHSDHFISALVCFKGKASVNLFTLVGRDPKTHHQMTLSCTSDPYHLTAECLQATDSQLLELGPAILGSDNWSCILQPS